MGGDNNNNNNNNNSNNNHNSSTKKNTVVPPKIKESYGENSVHLYKEAPVWKLFCLTAIFPSDLCISGSF